MSFTTRKMSRVSWPSTDDEMTSSSPSATTVLVIDAFKEDREYWTERLTFRPLVMLSSKPEQERWD